MKYRGSKMLFLMLLGLALTAAGVPAAERNGFVISTGEASLENTTPEDARREALNRARAAAIEEACGIRLQAETFVKDMKLMADFVHAVSYGNIVSEEILKWEVDTIQKSQRAPPALAYRVTLKVTDPNGCVSTCGKTVNVLAEPTCAVEGPDEACAMPAGPQ